MVNHRFVFGMIVLLIGVVWFSAPASAQRFQVGGDILLGFPQAEFSQNVDNTGFGISGFFLARLGSSPVYLGGRLGFLIYGNESRKEPFSTTIPDVTVDVETSNNILLGHLLMRFQVPRGAFRPYLEGAVGFDYLFTQTTIRNESNPDDEIASTTNFQDAAFSYGMGGGALIQVYSNPVKPKPNEPKKLTDVLIDLHVSYLAGGEAEYLKEGSIRREGGEVSYDVKRSRTDLLTVQIGVVFMF